MKNIIPHIENLLRKHDCVIIPGLGGFVANQVSVSYCADTNTFSPPSKQILFNALLTYNDGLLAQSIMEADFLSFEQAMSLINQDVKSFFYLLKKQPQYLNFGDLGTFSLVENKNLIFEPNLDFVFSPHTFGLQSASLFPLENKLIKADFSKSYAEKGSVSKLAWASIAAFIIVLLFPVGVFENPTLNKASVLSVQWEQSISQNVLQEESKNIEKDSQQIVLDSSAVQTTLHIEEEPLKIEQAQELKIEEKVFHVIIASLPSQQLANQYLQEIKADSLKSLSIIHRDNRFRVAVESFSNKQDAESFLKEFKNQHPQYAQAWVLKAMDN